MLIWCNTTDCTNVLTYVLTCFLQVIFLDMIDDADLEKINRNIKEDVALGVFARINHVRDAHLKLLSRMKTSYLNALRVSAKYIVFYHTVIFPHLFE
jgi:hypothetical protein